MGSWGDLDKRLDLELDDPQGAVFYLRPAFDARRVALKRQVGRRGGFVRGPCDFDELVRLE